MTELLLGVDIGTSSSKGVLATPEGEEVATARREHGVSRPRPGWAEQDAESIWWGDFVALCSELLDHSRGEVTAVCISGMSPCVLPATASGAPLRAGILYGVDTRAAHEIEELSKRYGSESILQRCGSALSTQAIGPKLLWLAHNEPEIWARTRRWFMPASFIVYRLTGEYVLDRVSASQSVPLYGLESGRWVDEWWDDLAPDLERPALSWPSEVIGRIDGEAAESTGLPRGTPVCAGGVDTRAEAASVGVLDPGDALLMYGSTSFLLEVVDRARPHPKLWTTASFDADVYGLTGGIATSGALIAWFKELAGAVGYDRLFADAESVPAGSEGLVALPYFSGERTPLFDPRARGALLGLTLSHGRGHVFRSLLESIAYAVRHNLETMAEAGGKARDFMAVGGGVAGGLWTQIVSDVCGVVQHIPKETTGASYGDAWIGGLATGLVERGTTWNPPARTIEPDDGSRAVYDELYALYRELYPVTADHAHRLAELQSGPRRGWAS